MTNYIYIATSLDGFIAAEDGGIDWLNEVHVSDESDFGFSDFMKKIDALVMGRNTFEQVISFNQWVYTKPVFVISNTLEEIPEGYRDKAELINGDIRSIVGLLDKRGYSNLYIDGGKTIRSFLREGLIDDMIITKIPVLLGKGIPLFGDIDDRIQLEHVETEIFANGLVKDHYRIRK